MWSWSQRAVWFWAGHLKSELQNKDNNSNSFVYPTRLLRSPEEILKEKAVYTVWLTGQVYSGTVAMPHGVKRDLLVPSVPWNENHVSGKTENYCKWWIPFSPCLPAPSSCSLFALTKVQTIFFTVRDGGQLLSWVGLLFTGFLWILYSLPPNITLSSHFLLALNIAGNTFELPWWLRQ